MFHTDKWIEINNPNYGYNASMPKVLRIINIHFVVPSFSWYQQHDCLKKIIIDINILKAFNNTRVSQK